MIGIGRHAATGCMGDWLRGCSQGRVRCFTALGGLRALPVWIGRGDREPDEKAHVRAERGAGRADGSNGPPRFAQLSSTVPGLQPDRLSTVMRSRKTAES